MKAVDQVITDRYALYQGDCCELIKGLPEASVHFGIHSPPFEGLYKFSNSERDISNSEGETFWRHYGFLIKELYRVTKPGRLHAVHCMQLPTSKARNGHIGMRDFRGDIIRAYCGNDDADRRLNEFIGMLADRLADLEEEGEVTGLDRIRDLIAGLRDEQEERAARAGRWILHSEVCIWKDPVVAQTRTKSIRLLHKQLTKDANLSGQGLADYMVMFRKPGENETAIAGMFDRFIGPDASDGGLDLSEDGYAAYCRRLHAEGKTPWPFEMWRSVSVWQRYASPVWMDIRQTRTLQYRSARDHKDEQHISPLQLDVIERCLELWSLPGETVLTPFLGIGSEVYSAVEMGRRGIGFELKPNYFVQAKRNIALLDLPPEDRLFEDPESATELEDADAQ